MRPGDAERAETIARAIQTLPPLQREALILAEYEEMSLEDIASTTEAEVAAVKSRLHRARSRLRQILERGPLADEIAAVWQQIVAFRTDAGAGGSAPETPRARTEEA